MANSLWGDDFVVESTKKKAKQVIKKVSEPKTPKVKTEGIKRQKGVTTEDQLDHIKSEVYRILGSYKENTIVIRTREQFKQYIDQAINNGVIAIDTETNNSLDPLTCKLMGPCIYTPGQKNAYIPINHTDLQGNRFDWQLTESVVKEQFDRLSNTKIIMHNGKFDYEVIKCTCDCELDVYWDTLIGARILNENERAGLKEQYIRKIDSSIEKYSIEGLFEGLSYSIIDPELFALYAATDSYMTYRLYEYQRELFDMPKNDGLLRLFMDIEMPVLKVNAHMELTGISLDVDYATELSIKYHKQSDDIDRQIEAELHKYDSQIKMWRNTSDAQNKSLKKGWKYIQGSGGPGDESYYVDSEGNQYVSPPDGSIYGKSKSEQLEDPVSVTSPTQLAIFLYDVLAIKPVDKKSPRGTGEAILKDILKQNPDLHILDLILDKREVAKLISTYIDKLPQCINEKTKRVHCKFNQCGADTGRMSSSEPNLQNIPSHNQDIRKMFKATDGYVMMSSDYSQQEPKALAALCRMNGDSQMYDVFMQGKDLYSEIASKSFHKPYEECREFNSDGSTNKEGKARRSQAKTILLGVLYGRGEASIAEQLSCSLQEAKDIKESVFKGFPAIKQFEQSSLDMARKCGYVTTIYKRRRRLPDIQLEKFEVSQINNSSDFNPLLGSRGLFSNYDTKLIESYKDKANKCRYKKELDNLKIQALADGISIKDNGGFISQAERQCVNARIQGSAADLTKAAMIALDNDERAKEIGMQILVPVHDELIVECKKEYAKEGKELLASIMSEAAEKILDMPIKCDVSVTERWYGDELDIV